ncbi:MAG: hypothetical protein AB7S93_08820 [Xanthobacteraceae bacterium]
MDDEDPAPGNAGRGVFLNEPSVREVSRTSRADHDRYTIMTNKITEQQRATRIASKQDRDRDAVIAMQEYEAGKAAVLARTARLRAMRLAQEADTKAGEEAADAAADKSAAKRPATKSAAKQPASKSAVKRPATKDKSPKR